MVNQSETPHFPPDRCLLLISCVWGQHSSCSVCSLQSLKCKKCDDNLYYFCSSL